MNPYEPSQLTELQEGGSAPLDVSRIWWEWERRRMVYSLVLLSGIIGITAYLLPRELARGRHWIIAFFSLVVANLLYFAGPLLEVFLCWINGKRIRFGHWLYALVTMTMLFLLLWGYYELLTADI